MSIPFNGHDPEILTETYHLLYVVGQEEGYSRIKKGNHFIFLDCDKKEIEDKKRLERLKSLVIPPAWEQVWICKEPNGHLQVTGIDTRGRKQYRYHPQWEKIRNETKFDRLYYFGKKLKNLRSQLQKDLRQRKLNKSKVTALAISVMQDTLIRMGNKTYEQEYGSHGLTTLRNKHVRFESGMVLFKFKGKKGVLQQTKLRKKSLQKLLKKVKELPGQKLFQYYDEEGNLHSLSSSDLNDYLHQHMSEAFTAKDFRTWFGCITALQTILEIREKKEELQGKKLLIHVIDKVAERLGNTRTVCRKYYIHPQIISGLEEESIDQIFPFNKINYEDTEAVEKAFMKFLKKRVVA